MSVAVERDRVSNARLRKEYERRHALGWLDCDLVAARLGWMNIYDKPDGSRVLRVLGMSVSYNRRNGIPARQGTVSYERAAELARAIGCDPYEVGL